MHTTIKHHIPTKFILRTLLITAEKDHRLISIFKNCNCTPEETAYDKAKRKIVENSYDLFCIEVSPNDNRGLALIPLLKVVNPMAYIISITQDNQRIVEEKARILKVNYHLVSPYSINEIKSIVSHLATRRMQAEEKAS